MQNRQSHSITDDSLIQRFLDGEVVAFNSLVWRWQKPIYNFVLRYIASTEDAKDITQRTFFRAYKNLHKLKDRQKFSSWLYQIALNLCRDEAKLKHHNLQVSLDAYNENGGHNIDHELQNHRIQGSNPEKVVEEHELQEILQQALTNIPEEQRTVVIMKEYQGLKFHEIAEILELPVNTVKSRMYYGLNAMRKLLNQWNITKETVHYEL